VRVGIDVFGAVPGAMGGVESYFRNVFRGISEDFTEHSFTLICDEKSQSFADICGQLCSTRVFKNRRGAPERILRSLCKKTLMIDCMKLALDKLPLDVIHFPFSVMSTLCLKIPTVLTFHDMQHEYYPKFFAEKELESRRRIYKASARHASRIIAISNHVKDTLIGNYDIPPERIDVVYPGCGVDFCVVEDVCKLQDVRNKYDLTKPFMYYPAASWPHKNHKRLLMALRLIVDRHGFDGELILTGITKSAHGQLREEISCLGLEKKVRMLGYVPYEDLPMLYNLARMLVFPSLFEGFGIPLVEAMACGCPVVCSNVTSIPEVVADSAVTFDPCSHEDMVEKIWMVWNDDGHIEKLRLKGIARAKCFSWKKTAQQTMEIYRVAAERI